VISQLRAAPNQLTLLRMVFIPFVVMAIVDRHYRWGLALFIIAGLSDALDGLLARLLKQQTALGQYLDPVADKLLLSTLFLVLAFEHTIPWFVTVMVFARDLGILVVSALLYITTTVRDLRPSIWGKANTVVQVATVLIVLLYSVWPQPLLGSAKYYFLRATFALTLISWIHYTVVIGQKLRGAGHERSAA